MPELPDVETIKNDLLPEIVGCRFTGVTLFWGRAVKRPSPDEFCRRLVGQAITGLKRRGKFLIFHLSSGELLILHLRMSGSLLLRPASSGPDPYTRNVFHLDGALELRFCDPRKLGMMWLVEDEKAVVGKLGPEPLDPSFTAEFFANRLSQHAVPIKALLCDQGFLAGVGNMYADEALFAARIHPLKKGRELSREEAERLHGAIRQVLEQGIACKGATVRDYRNPFGQPGTAQLYFQVAHRGGERCYACGTPIERIPIRNRGTYFCPRCQETS